jgi:probable rRNA maturation factor
MIPGPLRVSLSIANRQRSHRINLSFLRSVMASLIDELHQIEQGDLSICVVGETEMTRLNETYLKHQGSTDVITFDYREDSDSAKRSASLQGEIFVCLDEALVQARRFGTDWQTEMVRYVVHGILHLLGYDDHGAVKRRKMKREENRLLKLLASRFVLRELSQKSKVLR